MKTLEELYTLFCNYKKEYRDNIKENSYYYIRNYIKYSKENCYNEYFCQEVLDDWSCRKPDETKSGNRKRIEGVRQFLIFINRNKYASVIIPGDIHSRSLGSTIKKQTERPFIKTIISEYLEEYIQWLKDIGKYSEAYHDSLVRFNKALATKYPNAKELTYSMITDIFTKRVNERASSCNQRNKPVMFFLEFANWRNMIKVDVPPPLNSRKMNVRIPHAFTDNELSLLFEKVDNLQPTIYEDDNAWKFRRIQAVTIFRLLFSTGMRTNEARGLKREDVDLEEGIINIETTKGYHQHRVALHPSMTNLLKVYDSEMDKLMPDRQPFFPDDNGNFHSKEWITKIFRDCWHEISDEDARAYDLRSNYAVRNINSWKLGEPKWIDKFMYLSRSMGHSHLQSTAYYYHLVPMFREVMEQQSGKNIERLQPNMQDFLSDENGYDD